MEPTQYISRELYNIMRQIFHIKKNFFQAAEISFTAFKSFLKYKLEEIRNACSFEEKDDKFELWLLMYDCL